MASLSENNITSQFIGRSICIDRLIRCARKNRATQEGTEYIVYSCGFLYDQELRVLFGVTDKLKDLWERRGTEFNIYLYITDNVMNAAKILKYTESGGARPTITTPKCTQQELRIAQRILDYITGRELSHAL